METFDKVLHRRSRILIHSLIISGTLNIALLATFFTFILQDQTEAVVPTSVQKPAQRLSHSNQEVLQEFSQLPYDALVRELYNETHVEEGERRCDLALAFLGAFHHFDIERAFSGYPFDKREMALFSGEKITLYPGLSPGALEGVRIFARTEAWPLTPKGLFLTLQSEQDSVPALRQAFESTTEYFVIRRAFHRLPYRLEEEALFALVVAGTWQSVEALSREIQNSPDGMATTLAPFLLPRIEEGSKLAAHLLVLLEKDYALKKLDNDQMKTLLSLLTDATPEVTAFRAEVQRGIRPLPIRELAGGGQKTPPPRSHTVAPGDSLWKISRTYGVKIETIQEMNSLSSQHLQPGIELLLPPEEGH